MNQTMRRVPENRDVGVLAQPFRLDPIHLRILQILERDGRASVSSIAREVGLTDNAVRYRIRKLRESGVVKRVTVHVDPTRLGKGRIALVLLRLANGTDAARLLDHPCVAMQLATQGPYHAAALVVARDAADLDRFVQAHLRNDPRVQETLVLEVGPDAELPVRPSACTRSEPSA